MGLFLLFATVGIAEQKVVWVRVLDRRHNNMSLETWLWDAKTLDRINGDVSEKELIELLKNGWKIMFIAGSGRVTCFVLERSNRTSEKEDAN